MLGHCFQRASRLLLSHLEPRRNDRLMEKLNHPTTPLWRLCFCLRFIDVREHIWQKNGSSTQSQCRYDIAVVLIMIMAKESVRRYSLDLVLSGPSSRQSIFTLVNSVLSFGLLWAFNQGWYFIAMQADRRSTWILSCFLYSQEVSWHV